MSAVPRTGTAQGARRRDRVRSVVVGSDAVAVLDREARRRKWTRRRLAEALIWALAVEGKS